MAMLQMGTLLPKDTSFPQISTTGDDSVFHQIEDAVNYKMHLFYVAETLSGTQNHSILISNFHYEKTPLSGSLPCERWPLSSTLGSNSSCSCPAQQPVAAPGISTL